MKTILSGLASAALLIGLWEGAVRLFDVPPYMLPGPLRVADAFRRQGGFLLEHAAITAYETVLGFVLGIVAGSALALAMWLLPLVRRALLPAVLVTQALPVFAIAPILVLWLGFGLSSKIVMAVLVIFFAVTSTYYDGLRRLDAGLADLARLYRVGRFRELIHFRIPSALPALASGIRIAAVFAPIGAIVGEWVGAKGGLAFIMLQSNARMQTDMMFAALVLLAAMVLLLRFAVERATRRLVPWQRED
ncbi:ABC transporter permease [Polymorphum gilvum]|uniref:ABC transporter, permease protein, putative n=1 Tax=Polymorphum gilvum (strain LMG 25793 / CGMCC 1.9160 / SL003B-26A1) TaxID=991905 RepID=F2IX74_POLGS|nr:ABC transporter permease [Polymorphum gilvum]ADZ69365.1 ABC transporter, permease protein, putative [Polymorphum gilvum SL003B-26A1]